MRLLFLICALVLISTIGPANAAVITYRFTASQFGSSVGSGLPANSFVSQASPLSTISGMFSYDTSAVLLPGGDGITFDVYADTPTLALDQFSTLNPQLPPVQLLVGNDPMSGDQFLASPRTPTSAGLPFGFYDSFRLSFFDAEATTFSSTTIPSSLLPLSQFMDQFDVATLTLFTWNHQGNPGFTDRSFVRFDITSLAPVNEIPAPGALILFATAMGVAGLNANKRRRTRA